MRFLLQHRSDVAASASPYRVVEQDGGEVAWINRFLDWQRVRGLNELSLRAYGHLLLHFIRWWAEQPGVDVMRQEAPSFVRSAPKLLAIPKEVWINKPSGNTTQ